MTKSTETFTTSRDLVRDRLRRLAEIQQSGGRIVKTGMLAAFVQAEHSPQE